MVFGIHDHIIISCVNYCICQLITDSKRPLLSNGQAIKMVYFPHFCLFNDLRNDYTFWILTRIILNRCAVYTNLINCYDTDMV